MKSILNPTFKYVNAASTDLRATFARVRAEQAAEALARQVEREATHARAHPEERAQIVRRKA